MTGLLSLLSKLEPSIFSKFIAVLLLLLLIVSLLLSCATECDTHSSKDTARGKRVVSKAAVDRPLLTAWALLLMVATQLQSSLLDVTSEEKFLITPANAETRQGFLEFTLSSWVCSNTHFYKHQMLYKC